MDIKALMNQKGMSLKDTAVKMGISSSALSQMLSGNPTIQKLQDVADAIGCERWEFFKDEITPDALLAVCKDQIDAEVERRVAERLEKATALAQPTPAEYAVTLGAIVCPHCGEAIKIMSAV